MRNKCRAPFPQWIHRFIIGTQKKEEKECKQDILDMTQNYPQIAFDVLPDLRRGRSVLLKPELFVEASANL